MAIDLPDTAVKDIFRRKSTGFAPRPPMRQTSQVPEQQSDTAKPACERVLKSGKIRVQLYISFEEFRQVVNSRAEYPSYSAYIEAVLKKHLRRAGTDPHALFGDITSTKNEHSLNLRLSAETVSSVRSCIQRAVLTFPTKQALISISSLIRAAIRADMNDLS